jgi:hypothetical protein
MPNVKKDLEDLERSLAVMIKKKTFLSNKRYETFNYEEKQRAYLRKEVDMKLKRLSASFSCPDTKDSSLMRILPGLEKDFEEIKQKVAKYDEDSLEKAIEMIEKILEKISEIKEEKIISEFSLPAVPKEIKSEIQANFDKLLVCFDNSCYRSSLILCGKILEIALHRKYFEATEKDLLEKSPDIGLGNLIAKMREANIEFDPGLPQQIHLINQLRVFSVHKKSQVFSPSKEQAKATILYTLDTVRRLFSQ